MKSTRSWWKFMIWFFCRCFISNDNEKYCPSQCFFNKYLSSQDGEKVSQNTFCNRKLILLGNEYFTYQKSFQSIDLTMSVSNVWQKVTSPVASPGWFEFKCISNDNSNLSHLYSVYLDLWTKIFWLIRLNSDCATLFGLSWNRLESEQTAGR